jgi:hypothetical protein
MISRQEPDSSFKIPFNMANYFLNGREKMICMKDIMPEEMDCNAVNVLELNVALDSVK